MSIGASVLGAVVLGIIIEKINKKQIFNSRCSLLKSSISIAKETIKELDNVFENYVMIKILKLTLRMKLIFLKSQWIYIFH